MTEDMSFSHARHPAIRNPSRSDFEWSGDIFVRLSTSTNVHPQKVRRLPLRLPQACVSHLAVTTSSPHYHAVLAKDRTVIQVFTSG